MGARGEGQITTDEGTVQVLYTNRALAEAETELKQSVIAVAQGFTQGGSGIVEIAVLLRCGMEAARRDARLGGRAVTLNDAYEVLDQAGFTEVAAVVMSAVSDVLSYRAEGDPNPN